MNVKVTDRVLATAASFICDMEYRSMNVVSFTTLKLSFVDTYL